MGLQWVRLDTAIARNHKIEGLVGMREGHRSAFVYICAIAYCGDQETDGYIPVHALKYCHARVSDMNRLAAVGLVEVADGIGWFIPDWGDRNPLREITKAKSDAARANALKRWGKTGKPDTPAP